MTPNPYEYQVGKELTNMFQKTLPTSQFLGYFPPTLTNQPFAYEPSDLLRFLGVFTNLTDYTVFIRKLPSSYELVGR